MDQDLKVDKKKFSRSNSVSTSMQEKSDFGHHINKNNFLSKTTSDLFIEKTMDQKKPSASPVKKEEKKKEDPHPPKIQRKVIFINFLNFFFF